MKFSVLVSVLFLISAKVTTAKAQELGDKACGLFTGKIYLSAQGLNDAVSLHDLRDKHGELIGCKESPLTVLMDCIPTVLVKNPSSELLDLASRDLDTAPYKSVKACLVLVDDLEIVTNDGVVHKRPQFEATVIEVP
jgi:hypothetical protein